MNTKFVRASAFFCATALCGALLALPAAAAEVDAPYAESGDYDYIRNYVVTVDPREDGSADITYDIDWQVIDGDATDYLSWVKIGLANASVDELTPLTDTNADLQYSSDGGSYAKVVFARRYYAPDVAEENGGESSVHFAFSVHQSHLFTKNDDGTANFNFTPGWFDDLSVENMQVRWRNYDGFVADNNGIDGDYLTWDFGALRHGQQAMVHVTVPVTNAAAFDPAAEMTTDDYDSGEDLEPIIFGLTATIIILGAIVIIIIAINSDRLAKEVDFFSIGTNDLTQYTLACDRQNNDLGRFYNPHHVAVLRLIRMVTENAHKNGIWVGICGELGADLSLTETFLAMGVDELSVTPRSVLPLRNAVRMTDTRESTPRILADLDADYTAR